MWIFSILWGGIKAFAGPIIARFFPSTDEKLGAAQNEVKHETADNKELRQQAQDLADRPRDDDDFARKLRESERKP
jgi:hypothetical protein